VVVLLILGAAGRAAAEGPIIRLSGKGEADPRAAFEVSGLDAANLRALASARWEPDRWAALFAVYVDDRAPRRGDRPPVLGSYRVTGDRLRFEPRFPLAPGVRYRALFEPSRLPHPAGTGSAAAVGAFTIPKPDAAPTVVTQVYPSADRLPENLLRFYVHFSAPMSRGEAYDHVRLLDAAGRPVPSPFLEVGEELWDPAGKRFTLLLDPGRIKRGLKPREDLGPVLEAGKKYTLEIDRGWSDAGGNPLRATHRKTFQAVAAAEQSPDPKAWRIQPPPAGTPRGLDVAFPAPLDHALLGRMLRVTDPAGRAIAGTVTVAAGETGWRFTPARPWQPGDYRLVVDPALEDVAGNSVGRPFEVDTTGPARPPGQGASVVLPVSIVVERPKGGKE
jgi:hypothetical protein